MTYVASAFATFLNTRWLSYASILGLNFWYRGW